jgi:uncharacterized membrane protein YphA (DoxX/SURF4 family)
MPPLPRPSEHALLALVLRLVLGTFLVAGPLSLLLSGLPAPAAAGAPAPWLPLHVGPAVHALGVPLLLCGVLLLLGWHTWRAALAAGALLCASLVVWLVDNRLYNTMNHLLPFTAMAAGLLVLAPGHDTLGVDGLLRPHAPRPSRAASLGAVVLLARVFLGSIFVAQGFGGVSRGVVAFAERNYVSPLVANGTWVPEPLLWAAGVTNPPTQLLGGLLLLLGLATRPVAGALALFLCSIAFGHVLKSPFDPGPGVHSYALANLLVALVVLGLAHRAPAWGLDGLLGRWRQARGAARGAGAPPLETRAAPAP